MKTINLDKTFAAAIVALILISTAIGALLVQQYFPQIGTIKAEGPEDPLEAWSEASYVIWQYNSTHYACRNMSTNMVESLSTNASAVINNAVGNLSVTGGTLFIKNGNYSSVHLFVTPPNANWELNIVGEDKEQTILCGGNVTSIIECNNTAWNQDGLYWHRYINLYNLKIRTTGNENYAVYMPFMNTRIVNCYVVGPLTSTGNEQISVKLGGAAAPAYPSLIDGLEIDRSGDTTNVSALMLYTWFEGLQINGLTLQTYSNATYLWRIYGTSSHTSSLHVYIQYNCRVTSAIIYVLGTLPNAMQTFDFIFVATPPSGGSQQIGGSYLFKVAPDFGATVKVLTNWINMTDVTYCYDLKTKQSINFNNIGFVTEAWGTNSTADDGGLQAHGLAGTPNYVFVTSGNTTINCICSVGSLGATYFTYNLEDDASASLTGQTVYWYAVYTP